MFQIPRKMPGLLQDSGQSTTLPEATPVACMRTILHRTFYAFLRLLALALAAAPVVHLQAQTAQGDAGRI